MIFGTPTAPLCFGKDGNCFGVHFQCRPESFEKREIAQKIKGDEQFLFYRKSRMALDKY